LPAGLPFLKYGVQRVGCLPKVSHGWGGAAQMLEYAIKKKKMVFNFGKWEPGD